MFEFKGRGSFTYNREVLEELELATLAPYAAKSKYAERRYPEERDPFRTQFQRDRDRIIYSTAFRRLQNKTQVFVVHEGDFYRTRLTHTLEVMQHARTLARYFGANEDLVEAISLVHDIGHPPFGHGGEEELKELMRDYGGFDHNLQGLRIVDLLEQRYPQFPGLNLCWETREGIARHQTAYDHPEVPEEFWGSRQPGIEAQIVNIADELAFCAHDLDDALRVGLISEEILKDIGNPLWREVYQRARREIPAEPERRRKRAVRHLIELLNIDVMEQTMRNIEEYKVQAPEDVRNLEVPLVDFSEGRRKQFCQLRDTLYQQVYTNPVVLMMLQKGRKIVRELFQTYVQEPRLLPRSVQEKLWLDQAEEHKYRVVCDYVSGMTDRFAMDTYQMMFEPYEKILMSLRHR